MTYLLGGGGGGDMAYNLNRLGLRLGRKHFFTFRENEDWHGFCEISFLFRENFSRNVFEKNSI
jgi:hypothetical protein